MAGSGVGDRAVCTLVNALDNVLIDGVPDVQFTVAVDAAAEDDMTEGTVIAAATSAASGSAKAHLRNMNRW